MPNPARVEQLNREIVTLLGKRAKVKAIAADLARQLKQKRNALYVAERAPDPVAPRALDFDALDDVLGDD